MPQHLWISATILRVCEVCGVRQIGNGQEWVPHVSAICPGDDEDGPPPAGRRGPHAPAPTGRVLEAA